MNVLIVGASSGIGEAVAKLLNRDGNTLFLVARREERLFALKEELSKCDSYVYPCDITKYEEIPGVFDHISEKGIKLDGLVFSAGINRDIPIRNNDIDDMDDVMSTNVLSFVEICKAFSKKKISNDGASVVAISSIASRSATPAMCTYTASKAALNAVVKVYAKEMLKRRVRVNAILPGFVDTDMAKEAVAKYGDIPGNQPLGVIDPVQVAYLAEFLLSDRASYITGSLYEINGGDF